LTVGSTIFHDWVSDSDDSIEEYVNNATAIFCGNKNQTLNHISIALMLKQRAPNILMTALCAPLAMLLLDDGDFNWSFNFQLLVLLVGVASTISNLIVGLVMHPATVRASQSFFKPTEKQNAGVTGENFLNYAQSNAVMQHSNFKFK